MTNPPSSPRTAVLAWAQAHVQPWLDNDSQIGISEAQALAMQTKYEAAAAAIAAQDSAKQAAAVATVQAQTAFTALRAQISNLMAQIRGFAENMGGPNVYNLAQIPPPAAATPAPPPAQPSDLKVGVDATTGEITLSWKATNPPNTQGTSYIVRRRTSPSADFAFIGVTGTKKFVDTTFFAGPDSVQYTVQGQRADSSGPVSAIFTVNFGRLPGGGMSVASITSDAASPVKLAA